MQAILTKIASSVLIARRLAKVPNAVARSFGALRQPQDDIAFSSL
jgi:hypothetical protein